MYDFDVSNAREQVTFPVFNAFPIILLCFVTDFRSSLTSAF
jgi:hypothetical protein